MMRRSTRHADSAGVAEVLARRADEHAGPRVRDGRLDGLAHDLRDARVPQGRHEIPPHAREDACRVVRRAEEDAVDEALEAGAEGVEEQEHGEREDDGEDRRLGHRVGAERAVEEDDARDVRRTDRARQHEVVRAPLHHRVDLEEVVHDDRVAHGEREKERGVAREVHGDVAAAERRGDEHDPRQGVAEERAQRDDAHALSRERRAPPPVLEHRPGGEGQGRDAEQQHVQGQDP
jgi:hypothetical protein